MTSQLTVESSIDRGENAWGLGWACADSQFSVTSMLELHQPGSRKTSIERALLESFKSEGDGSENVKAQLVFQQNSNVRASRFFCTYISLMSSAQLRRENC